MSEHVFGAGSMWAQRNDGSALYTPLKFGVLQETSFEFARSIKALYGSKNLPIALGPGEIKPSGKAKKARIFMQPYAELFFGQSYTTGQSLMAEDEAGTIPDTPGPYTVQVTNHTTFLSDLGVKWATTGLPLTKVDPAVAPTTGQYNVITTAGGTLGTYTFAAADKTLGVSINYEYSSATGKKLVITNQLIGVAPTFQCWFRGIYQSKQMTLKLFNCMSNKLSFATKLSDWMIPEFDFDMACNDADILGELSMAE